MKARAFRSLVNSPSPLCPLPRSLLFGGGGKSSDRDRPGRRLSIRLPDAIGGGERAAAASDGNSRSPSGVMLCLHFALTSSLILLLLSCCLIQSLERAWQMRETHTKAGWLAGAILSEVDGKQENQMQSYIMSSDCSDCQFSPSQFYVYLCITVAVVRVSS